MDTLELRWRPAGEAIDNGRGEETEYLYLEAWVNGEPLQDFEQFGFGLGHLMASTEGSGLYFIIVCTCGDYGCAGIAEGVAVKHEADCIRWEISEPSPFRVFQFDRRAYISGIHAGIEECRQLVDSRRESGGTPFRPWPQDWINQPDPANPWYDELIQPLRSFEDLYQREFGDSIE